MASERYPVIEILDGLRQYLYVPPPFRDANNKRIDVWADIAEANPLWQLDQRRQYTLNTPRLRGGQPIPILDDDGLPTGRIERNPNPFQPYDPPPPPDIEDIDLPRPQLFDSLEDIITQAGASNEALTATTVFWNDQESVPEVAAGKFTFTAHLIVVHQNNPNERVLRYMNWFNHAMRGTLFIVGQETEVDILTLPARNIRNLIDAMARTTISKPNISGGDRFILERIAACSLFVQVEMQYLNKDDGSIVDPTNELNYLPTPKR